MELLKAILLEAIKKEKITISFPKLKFSEVIESESFKALKKIHQIICDADKSDSECFTAIEEIVCAFEDLGISCESRHDF